MEECQTLPEPIGRDINLVMNGDPMADETKEQTVTLQELMVSMLAMTDAAIKLLI